MTQRNRLLDIVDKIGPDFAARAAARDQSDDFVAPNYAVLKEHKFFSAAIPEEFGGGGATHSEMCEALRALARHCGSTALCLSMHQHLVAAAVYNARRGKPGRKLLDKVVEGELVLVSTGANDWMESSGTMTRVEGGYRLTAKKPFASGSPAGNLLITSSCYDDPADGPQVLHFPIPLSAEGVRIEQNWKAMGMRGTGSNTVVLENVFVPDAAVALRRPRGVYHPVWNTVLTVAMPLIMSVYVGVAEAAAAIVRKQASRRATDPVTPFLLGEMENELATAQMAVDAMVAIADDGRFEATLDNANAILIRKTIASRAAIRTVEKAMEATGGGGYFRAAGLERLLRDVQASQFHPLQQKRQHQFTGRMAMGLDPIEGTPRAKEMAGSQA